MTSYAGFDRADCPDLATMAVLKAKTNLVWCGYYLKAPSQPATTWIGKRGALVAQGWGIAPIYVGQQITGPGSHNVTADHGTIDGAQACTDLTTEGFPQGTWVYLDLENGPPFTSAQHAYVEAWADAVTAGGFNPGVYCSFLYAGTIALMLPNARIWVYHVPSVDPHAVPGGAFGSPEPSASGFPPAAIWQWNDEARLTAFGNLAVDLNVSIFADPGAPSGVIIFQERTFDVGSPQWVQQSLNKLGASLTVDGNIGLVTMKAIADNLQAQLTARGGSA